MTESFCRDLSRPCLVLDADQLTVADAIASARNFIDAGNVRVLNVAGQRASEWPDAAAYANAVVAGLLATWDVPRGA